jgi:hypothetical protein
VIGLNTHLIQALHILKIWDVLGKYRQGVGKYPTPSNLVGNQTTGKDLYHQLNSWQRYTRAKPCQLGYHTIDDTSSPGQQPYAISEASSRPPSGQYKEFHSKMTDENLILLMSGRQSLLPGSERWGKRVRLLCHLAVSPVRCCSLEWCLVRSSYTHYFLLERVALQPK